MTSLNATSTPITRPAPALPTAPPPASQQAAFPAPMAPDAYDFDPRRPIPAQTPLRTGFFDAAEIAVLDAAQAQLDRQHRSNRTAGAIGAGTGLAALLGVALMPLAATWLLPLGAASLLAGAWFASRPRPEATVELPARPLINLRAR